MAEVPECGNVAGGLRQAGVADEVGAPPGRGVAEDPLTQRGSLGDAGAEEVRGPPDSDAGPAGIGGGQQLGGHGRLDPALGNAEFMISADNLQDCEQFISQLAAVPHGGILPGGAAAQGGVQCLMYATSATKEPFSVTVGSDAPYNLCSLMAQDGYAQVADALTGPAN